jgi:hypothetical protein
MSYHDLFDWYSILLFGASPESKLVFSNFGSSFYHMKARTWALSNSHIDNSDRILRILDSVRFLQASNPRDMIFGILGLSDIFLSILPAPDYTASVTTIFTQVAKSLLLAMKSLDILYYAAALVPFSSYPSWVPDWGQLPHMWRLRENIFAAAGNSEALFAFSKDDREFQVKGKIFDKTENANFVCSAAYAISNSIAEFIPGFVSSCEAGLALKAYPTGESVEDALWRTLCWDMCMNRMSRAVPDRVTAFREWYRFLTSNVSLNTLDTAPVNNLNPLS